MVFSPTEDTTTTSTATSDGTEEDLSALEVAERLGTLMAPFAQFITAIVQALTAYTLIRQL